MPRLRWNGDSLFSVPNRNGKMVRPGEELDVPEDETDYYLNHWTGDWERVDDPEDATDGDGEDDSDAAETEDDAGDDDDFDVESFLDRTPVSDVADDIAAGDADGHLDAVSEAADRATVETAVDERREELAAEE